MNNLKEYGLAVFRIAVGLLMVMNHGLDKFLVVVGGKEIQFMDPIGIGEQTSFILAMIAEFVGGLFIIFGLWTRWTAAVLTFNMIVAAVIHLHSMPFAEPTKQMAYLFLLSFFLLMIFGGGKFSIDSLLKTSSRKRIQPEG